MEKYVEGYLGGFKAEDRMKQDKVAGRRDREELGETLNKAGNDRLIYIHFFTNVPTLRYFPVCPNPPDEREVSSRASLVSISALMTSLTTI